jgi:hypothetical protein
MAVSGMSQVVPERAGAVPPVFGKEFHAYRVCDVLVKFPAVCLASCGFVLCSLAVVSLLMSAPISVDISLFSAGFTDISFANAADKMRERWLWQVDSARSTGELAPSPVGYRLVLTFEAERASMKSLLDRDGLTYMHSVEATIARQPRFDSLCWKPGVRGSPTDDGLWRSTVLPCAPFSSLLTYFYPGILNNVTGTPRFSFDGLNGVLQEPLDKVRMLATSNPRIAWFTFNSTPVQVLRSQITLRDTSAGEVDEFIDSTLSVIASHGHAAINVYLSGDRVADYHRRRALNRDSNLAIPGVAVALLVGWYHFHSIILSALMILQFGLTFLSARFFQLVFFQRETTMLAALNVFIGLTLTCHSAFVFFDTFKQSGIMVTANRKNLLSVSQRISITISGAGKGIFAAIATQILTFSIGTQSSIPAVASFCEFFCIVAVVNAVSMFTYFPAAVLFHHFHVSGSRRTSQKQKEVLLKRSQRKRFVPLKTFLEEWELLQCRWGLTCYVAARQFMNAELQLELAARNGHRPGVITPEIIRVPNPFGNSSEVLTTPEVQLDLESVDGQEFLDRFQDSSPAVGTTQLIFQFDHRNLDISATLRIKNINIDELLGFDDASIRFKLIEIGSTTPSALTGPQLDDIGIRLGIESVGPKSEFRLRSVVRQCVCLMYGNGRSLHKPTQSTHTAAQAVVRRAEILIKPKNVRFGFSRALADWWGNRGEITSTCPALPCRKCRSETEAEREARIMSTRTKPEGYSKAERWVFETWSPWLHRVRFLVILIATAWMGVACWRVSNCTISSRIESIDNLPMARAYELARQLSQGHCDYCSAYFESTSTFPPVNVTAIEHCHRTQVDGQMMFAHVDRCGVCFGTNDCEDCHGEVDGLDRLDGCGQCLPQADDRVDRCSVCSVTGSSMNCSFCRLRQGAPAGFTGANCAVRCDETNCPARRGHCNIVTGDCVCHADFSHGFWITDSMNISACSECATGFSGPSCTIECSSPRGPCDCVDSHHRCTGCPPGLVGSNCDVVDPSFCHPDHGKWTHVGCACESEWNDGRNCASQAKCSFHGRTYADEALPPGLSGCQCSGQWRGSDCSYCKCFNGGTCEANGTCVCRGGWSGVDCQRCSETCQTNGGCPLPMQAHEYDVRSCRAVFCSDDELKQKASSSRLCSSCDRTTALCAAIDPATCVSAGCAWDEFTSMCRLSATVTDAAVNCACRGRWYGGDCGSCNTSGFPGTSCDAEGNLVSCDGVLVQDLRYETFDECGQCGGQCVGCDGVVNSATRFDGCGVCGGDNACLQPKAYDLVFVVGLLSDGNVDPAFNFDNDATQRSLASACILLKSYHMLNNDSSCIMSEFLSSATVYPAAVRTRSEQLYYYALQTGRISDVGFTSPYFNQPNFRLRWLRFKTRSTELARSTGGYRKIRELLHSVNSATGLKWLIISEEWNLEMGETVIFNETTLLLLVAALGLTSILLVLTGSIAITAIGTLTIASHMLTVIALNSWTDQTIGGIEVCWLRTTLCLVTEQIVLLADNYVENLHEQQSNLFALDTTRLQASRQMNLRALPSLVASWFVLLAASCPFLAADIDALRRTATFLIISCCSQLVHSMIMFPAAVSALGPTSTSRTARKSLLSFAGSAALCTVVVLPLFLTHTIGL